MAMPHPLLDAFIARMPAVRARRQLDISEAVGMGMAGGEAYRGWRDRLIQTINGEPVRPVGFEPFLQLRARRMAEREAERARQMSGPTQSAARP